MEGENGLVVSDVESPFPRSSFGSIERYIEVRPGQDGRFDPGTVTVEYSPEHLGWVEPETLRLFRVDPEARTWELVPESGPDGRGLIRGRIDRPGLYGVVGLPRHPAVLEAVRRACALPHAVLAERPDSALAPICLQILCAPGLDRWTGAAGMPLEPPGGLGGTVCDLCVGLRPPANGLPECQLLEPPERLQPPEEEAGEKGRAYAVTAASWIGVAVAWGSGVGWTSWIEVFDLGFPITSIASYDIGRRWCTTLAVSSTGDRFFVGDVAAPGIAAYDGSGTLLGSVLLSTPRTGSLLLDCALSPDDATLYVAAPDGLVVIDATTRGITRVMPTPEALYAVSISPDGATVAAVGGGALYAFDAATFASKPISMPLNLQVFDVAFIDSRRAVVSTAGRLSVVDFGTGRFTALPHGFPGSGLSRSFLYAPRTETIYGVGWSSTPSTHSEIAALHIPTGTWATRQFPMTTFAASALTPGERPLVAEVAPSGGPESLSIYDPTSQILHRSRVQAPGYHIRDLEVRGP